jgi:hypothetical protein
MASTVISANLFLLFILSSLQFLSLREKELPRRGGSPFCHKDPEQALPCSVHLNSIQTAKGKDDFPHSICPAGLSWIVSASGPAWWIPMIRPPILSAPQSAIKTA